MILSPLMSLTLIGKKEILLILELGKHENTVPEKLLIQKILKNFSKILYAHVFYDKVDFIKYFFNSTHRKYFALIRTVTR